MEKVVSKTSQTQSVSMATVCPTTVSPTTVSMNIVSDTDDGEGMMEVIRSDGKQVYHTVNVNVNGVVKKMEIPIGQSTDSLSKSKQSATDSPKTDTSLVSTTINSMPLVSMASNEKKIMAMTSVANIASFASSLSVPKTSTSVRVVFGSPSRPRPSTASSPYVIKQAQKTVSILPATAKMPYPVIRPAVPGQINKPTIVLVPRNQALPTNRLGMQQMVMAASQGKGMPTVIPLPGGRFVVPKTQNISTASGGKPVVILPQGQGTRVPGTRMVVAPRPTVSLPPGFALVPVTSSNALKPSDVLNIPTTNKGSLDNLALNELLKSIAQQTVNSQPSELQQPTTNVVPAVRTVSLPTSVVTVSTPSVATASSVAPPPLKVLPFSISPSGLVMSTQSTLATQSSQAFVQLATASMNTSIQARKPMEMSHIKIDSVYSLNDQAKQAESSPEKQVESSPEKQVESSTEKQVESSTERETESSPEKRSESSLVKLDNSTQQKDDPEEDAEQDDKESSTTESPQPASPVKEIKSKTNGDSPQNEFKEDFVVLAEWAKESDNEEDGNEFDDTDVDSDEDREKSVSATKCVDDDNDPVDVETVPKDDDSLTKKEQSSTGNLLLDADDGDKKDDDKDSDTTEIADTNEIETDVPNSAAKITDIILKQSEEKRQTNTKQDVVKENKNPEPEQNQNRQEPIDKNEVSKVQNCVENCDTEVKVNVNETPKTASANGLNDGRYPFRLTTERSPEVKRVLVTNIKVEPGIKHRKLSFSPGKAVSESPRAKRIRRRKRKLKMMMKVMYWKREHKYMFDCKVLLPKLSNLDSSVDVNTFKLPVIPKEILSKVRFAGDANWSDVLIDRVPNRQHRRKRSEAKTQNEKDNDLNNKIKKKVKEFAEKKSRQEEIFIVKTVNGESKLVRVSAPDKKALLQSIAPKLLAAKSTTVTTASVGNTSFTNVANKVLAAVSSSSHKPIPALNVQSLPIKVSTAPTSLLSAKTVGNIHGAPLVTGVSSVPGVQKVIFQSGAGNKSLKLPISAKPNVTISQIAKPTGSRTVIALPTSSKGSSNPVLTTAKKGPVSLVPIAPAAGKKLPESIPITIGGTSISVPVSVLIQAQAMGCKLAFQVPTSSSGTPRPIFIQQTQSTVGGTPVKTTLTPSSGFATPRPLMISSTAGATTKSPQVPTSPPGNVKPIVIAPIPSSEPSTPDVTPHTPDSTSTVSSAAVTPVKPIIIQPSTTFVSTSVSSPSVSATSMMPINTTSPIISTAATTSTSSTASTGYPRGGNQRYLVLNTSSGKMIMPMPASMGGTAVTPGKSILNIPSVVPRNIAASLPTSLSGASGSPVVLMAKGTTVNTPGSQVPSMMINSGNQKTPMILKRVAPGAIRGALPKAVFTIRPAPPNSQATPVRTITPSMITSTVNMPRPVATAAPAPKQRSPAARQNRMIQRLSEFMSPAAAAALAATVPAEPIEITPRPIKIEPDDSAEFHFPIRIKDEPKTVGYGDEDGDPGPSLANVQIKDEPVSSDSGSDSEEGNGEPPSKQPRLDTSLKQTNGSTEPSPVPKRVEPPPTHDARSRIEELREKLRKAMADVDEIRQKRQVVAQSDDSNDDS